MAEQDRSRWDAGNIAEGVALLSEALPNGATGPYQLQAAIAAIHDEAATARDTDWAQIEALYELLLQIADNPVVMLNHAVAVGMARGPQAGLKQLDTIAADERIARDHRLPAVRAHLLEMAGDETAAHREYLIAARKAIGVQQQRYLHSRAARLAEPGHDPAASC
jgi:predicted RNA polymerase sigma factor